MNASSQSQKRDRRRGTTIAATVLGHSLATLVVSAVLLWAFVDRHTATVFIGAFEQAQFRSFLAPDLALHVGLSVCLWAFIYLVGAYLWRGGEPARVRLDKRRGAVMTETLVALPVLLMLIFGIAQLTVNNIAGIFTNLATIQAARSAWLWEREPCHSIECDPAERARAQAAAVLTPVAPGTHFINASDLPRAAAQLRGVLVGVQQPQLREDMGAQGMDVSSRVSTFGRRSGTFAEALDTQSYTVRTVRKFTFAYHATSVEVSHPGQDTIRIDLLYRHHNAFPMVSRIFGVEDSVAGRDGYYAHIERSFELKRLPEPNREAVTAPDHPKLY